MNEDLGEGVSTYYDRHALSVEDVDEGEDGEFNVPIHMDEHDRFQVCEMRVQATEKVLYFARVYAFHSSTYEEVNKYYLMNEEVLLKYEVHAI